MESISNNFHEDMEKEYILCTEKKIHHFSLLLLYLMESFNN